MKHLSNQVRKNNLEIYDTHHQLNKQVFYQNKSPFLTRNVKNTSDLRNQSNDSSEGWNQDQYHIGLNNEDYIISEMDSNVNWNRYRDSQRYVNMENNY